MAFRVRLPFQQTLSGIVEYGAGHRAPPGIFRCTRGLVQPRTAAHGLWHFTHVSRVLQPLGIPWQSSVPWLQRFTTLRRMFLTSGIVDFATDLGARDG